MLIKAIASTDPRYGKKPEERSVDELLSCCFINLDKQAGPTSHQVTMWVKEILSVNRTGHSGTLDPNASGVLPIGVNRATKLLSYLLLENKEYVALMRLHSDVSYENIEKVFSEYVGTIEQRVPLRSAVKKQRRKRNVYKLEIFEIDGRDVLFRAVVDSGTYIRTLCVDIGRALGTEANMVQLRRTRSSVFHERDSIILHNLLDAYVLGNLKGILLPVEYGFSGLPKVIVRDSAIGAICHGADLALPGVLQIDESITESAVVCIFSLKGELVAIGRALMDAKDMWERERGIAVNVESVAMERSTYPKLWD